MKKIYFLVSALIAFLIVSFVNVGALNQTTNFSIATNKEQIDINSGQYLKLAYQDGRFYSWNQSDDDNQHPIGIFNTTDQSYLLDSFGVFLTLDYQIVSFSRIDDTLGVANIKYFQSQDKVEYLNRNFLIALEDSGIKVLNDQPIDSQNNKFLKLNNDYILGFGLGLDMIRIKDLEVRSLVASDVGNYPTSFYKIIDGRGVFIAADRSFYLLTNFDFDSEKGVNEILIKDLKAPKNNKKHVVAINQDNLVIRAEENVLYFVDVSNLNAISINNWQWEDEDDTLVTSQADNFAFSVGQESFILNISAANSSSSYGTPYLIETSQWDILNPISKIKTINDFMFVATNNGIFIDKDLNASSFVFQNDGSSYSFDVHPPFGRLDSFQFVNKDLFFGLVANNNLLLSQTINSSWAITENIAFSATSSSTTSNFLNNIITTEEQTIDYQNTYFSNGTTNLNITDRTLNEVVVDSSEGRVVLRPNANNNITYDFSRLDSYQVEIYFSSETQLKLDYRVRIVDSNDEDLVSISGNNLEAYVGFTKKSLYDINLLDQNDAFTISEFNYQSLQYVKLFTYQDGVNTVVRNVYNLKNNSEIKVEKETDEPSYFFGLQVTNLLNQVRWFYLGFSVDAIKPMEDFWDSESGSDLMKQAMFRGYLEKDLRAMNSKQIKQLIGESNNWQTIAFQGKAIAVAIASIFALALIAGVIAVSFNFALNSKIEIEQVEKNKKIRNVLDH